IVRIDCAVRPSLPMTLPMSPSPTRSSRTALRSPSTSVTSTPSGSSTSARAIVATSCLRAMQVSSARDSGGARLRLEQAIERVRSLSAQLLPVLEALHVDGEGTRGVEGADVFDEAAVAGTAVLGDHDTIKRRLLRAVPSQADLNHVFLEVEGGTVAPEGSPARRPSSPGASRTARRRRKGPETRATC